MKVVFRTDASLQIGTGHVMRCLAFADALKERGVACLFICRPHNGHLLDLVAQRSHRAVHLPALETGTRHMQTLVDPAHAQWLGTDWMRDAEDTRQALGCEVVDWLVVDHYALDARWEQVLRPNCKHLMVIDDLADRPHDCDLLMDQNLGRSAQDYVGLLPPQTTTLIGPIYALLRPEFAKLRAESLAKRSAPRLKQLLITMGGVDGDNATGRVLDALKACRLPDDLEITVVMGPYAPWLQQVQAQAAQMDKKIQVVVGVSDMARLMSDSDLAIGAAGSTSWERCCLGLPTIQLVLAENQREAAAALTAVGAVVAVSCLSDLVFRLPDLLQQIQMNGDRMTQLAEKASKVCDGLGASVLSGRLVSELKINEVGR